MNSVEAPTSPIGRLLIVDDEENLREALCRNLAEHGYETVGCSCGKEALSVLQSREFDLLLTDLMMPGMNGLSLLAAALELDPTLAIIMMTGQATVSTAVDAMKSGAFDYITKPFKLNALRSLLSRAMQVRQLRTENLHLRETLAIFELSQAVMLSLDAPSILSKLADAAMQQCDADEASVMLPSQDGAELYVAVVRGEGREHILGEKIPITDGVAGWVARSKEPVLLHGKVGGPEFVPINPRSDIVSSVSVPIMAGGKLVGVLNVNATDRRRVLTLGQLKALSILTGIAGPVLQNGWLYQQTLDAEKKYRNIFENATEGIFQRTQEGRFITVNPSLARFLGYNSASELTENVIVIDRFYVEPGRHEEFVRVMEANGSIKDFESQVYCKDGSVIWISENARTVRDASETVLYYEGTAEDITARKNSEAEAAERSRLVQLGADVGRALVSGRSLRPILQGCSEAIVCHLDAAFARIWTCNETDQMLELQASAGMYTHIDGGNARVPIGELKIGLIAEERKPHLTNDVQGDPRVGDQEWAKREGMVSFAGYPLIVDERLVGVIAMFARKRLTDRTLDAMESVADKIALGIERERTHEALRKSEEQFRSVALAANDAIIIADGDGQIISWSAGAESMFQYRQDEMAGRPMMTSMSKDHPDQTRDIDHLHSLGKTVELYGLKKDQTEFPVELSMSTWTAGGERFYSAIIRDISERKHAEESRQKQLARLNLLNRIARVIAERNDLASIFRVVLTRLEQEMTLDCCGASLYDHEQGTLTIVACGAKSDVIVADVGIGAGSVHPIEDMFLSPCSTGQVVYIPDMAQDKLPLCQKLAQRGMHSTVGVPMMVQDRFIGTIVVMRNETDGFTVDEREFLRGVGEHIALAAHQAQLHQDLQEAYEEVRATQKAVIQQERLRALGTMASGIAHDFNNVLTPIVGYTELLLNHRNNLDDPDKVIRYLEMIQTGGKDAAAIVGRLREFYRYREETDVHPPVQLRTLIEQAVSLTRPRWKDQALASGRTIEIDADFQKVPFVAGNEAELREMLTNLIFNAVDAMPEGGMISIRLRPGGEIDPNSHVLIELTDTGTGMTDEVRQRCLEPFFSTKGEHGSGLGLAMVFGIIQRHDGTIDIQSELGKGTTFIIRLPVYVEMSSSSSKESPSSVTQPLRILAVDDEPGVREIVEGYLTEDGHTVVTAASAREGLELLGAREFDLVITDRAMPGLSGDQLASLVKKQTPDRPVILLTGFGDFMKAAGEMPEGVDWIVSKPVTISTLRNAIERAWNIKARTHGER